MGSRKKEGDAGFRREVVNPAAKANKAAKARTSTPKPSVPKPSTPKPSVQQIIKRTKKAFAPPTPKQLEQQAQAKARGGLTSSGIKKFESSSPQQQKKAIEKERVKLTGSKESKIKPKIDTTKLDPIKLQKDFDSARKQEFKKTGVFSGSLQDFQRIVAPKTRLTSQVLRVKPTDLARDVLPRLRKIVESNDKAILEIRTKGKMTKIIKKNDIITKKVKTKPFIIKDGRIEKAKGKKRGIVPFTQLELLKIKSIFKSASKEIKREAIAGVTGAVVSLLSIVRNPKKAVEDYKKSFKFIKDDPKRAAKIIVNKIADDPVEVATELIVFNKLLGLTSKLIKKSPIGKALSEELYIRSFPKEMQKGVRAIVKSSKVQSKLTPSKVKTIKRIDFVDVKNLNKLEARIVEKTVKETDSILFGSLPARTVSKGKTPKPKDVDLATKDINKFNKAFLKNLPKKLKDKYVIKNQKIIRKSDGVHILDVKPIDRLIPSKSIITSKGILPVSGFKFTLKIPKGQILPRLTRKAVEQKTTVPTERLIKVEGIKMVSFGEQTKRKGLGTIQVLVEKNARRAKDPQSFILSLEIQLDALKKSKSVFKDSFRNVNRIANLESAIKILKSKEFSKLLNSRVKGLTKEYPILGLFEYKKYAKKIKGLKKINRKDLIVKNGKIVNKKTGKILGDFVVSELPSQLVSVIPKTLRQSSLIPLIKGKTSSILPLSIQSKIPKFTTKPSKIPTSKVPKSRIPTSKAPPSKVPSSKIPPSKILISKVPSSKVPPSKIPPSKVPPSKVPTSRVPPSKFPTSKVPPSIIPPTIITTRTPPPLKKKLRLELEKVLKKMPKEKKKKLLFQFTPTLAGEGQVATRTTGQFTGFEVRGNIIQLKPIKVKKHKRKTLKTKKFVRRHRRRKPRGK